MGHEHDPTRTDARADGATAGPAAATASAPLVQVQALIAQGRGPDEVAGVLAAHPGARDEILAYLHMARGNAFVQQVLAAVPKDPAALPQAPVLQADSAAPKADALTGTKDMVPLTFEVDGQWVQIYVSPGGINHNPDVFMFFHGQSANLMIDPKVAREKEDNVSGNDSAGAAVAQAKAKNTVAILPQGVRGGGGSKGGQMPAMVGKGSLPKFLDDILAIMGPKLGIDGAVTPRHISLAGHSAGGYMGMHEALSTSGKYSDTITDLTLMDSSYADVHFEDAQSWMFTGSPGKTIKIVQSEDQLARSHNQVPDPTPKDPKHTKDQPGPAHWRGSFGEDALGSAARKHKMTLNQIQKFDWNNNDDRGNHTKALQHTQVMTADGKVQCDILVMQSDLGHHEIRDNVIDDAIDSIGQGPASANDFGKNHIDGYGRDPNAPHANNREHVLGEPEPEKPRPKKRTP